MVAFVEIQILTLGPGEFDAAEAHGTPQDGHRVISQRQFFLFLCGPVSGHDLQELTNLVFT